MIRKLNESYSDINSENVWDAYDIAEETLGSSKLALSLAKAMGTERLSTLLGYIFQDWDIPFGDNSYDEDEYFEEDDYVEESAPRKSSRKMRRVDEDTNWNQPTPTAKNVVRKALKDNGIQLMSEYNDEEQSKRGGKTGIRVKRVFTTDLSAEDMYDKKPEALVSAVREIKDRLGRDYSVLALPNSDDNWEVIVSKIALESKNVRKRGKRVVEDVSSRSMIYIPVKRKDCGDSECVVFAEVEDVDDPIDVYFCAVLPYDWENSEYDPNEGEVEGTYFTNRVDAMRWFDGY